TVVEAATPARSHRTAAGGGAALQQDRQAGEEAGPGDRLPDAPASDSGALRHGAAGPDADPGRRQPADAGTGEEARLHRFGGWRHQLAGQPVRLQRADVVDRQPDSRCQREARSDNGGGRPDHRGAPREAGHEGAAGPLDGEAAIAVLPVADAVRRVREGRSDGRLRALRRQPGADQQPGGQSAEGDTRVGAEDGEGIFAADEPHGAGGGGRSRGKAAGHGRWEMRTLAVVGILAASCFAQDREAPPPLGTPKAFALPASETFTLKNGMKVTLAQYGSVPLVTIRADMAFGKANESADQVWLSNLTIQLMREGT